VGNITTAGGKHRSVPCVGCHAGHPPDVKKPIALCSKCHFSSRKAHFGITGCLNCHARQVEQLSTNKSKHSALNCSMCHDVHRKIPECSRCHVPHSDKMIGDCKQCHKAHTPKVVSYAADLPSQNYGACHAKAFDLLSATTTKHKTLKCAFCHKDKDRKVAICKDCHGSPHPKGIMVKFPQC
jgi:hypothetical protein